MRGELTSIPASAQEYNTQKIAAYNQSRYSCAAAHAVNNEMELESENISIQRNSYAMSDKNKIQTYQKKIE